MSKVKHSEQSQHREVTLKLDSRLAEAIEFSAANFAGAQHAHVFQDCDCGHVLWAVQLLTELSKQISSTYQLQCVIDALSGTLPDNWQDSPTGRVRPSRN